MIRFKILILNLSNLVEESLNDILGDSDDEKEQDLVVNKILDEIGIEVSGKVILLINCFIKLILI